MSPSESRQSGRARLTRRWTLGLLVLVAGGLLPRDAGSAPALAVAPQREETVADDERETASRYRAATNPAVMRMTREQYRAAMAKLHPAFTLTPEEQRAAQLLGAWSRRSEWETLAKRWVTPVGIGRWGISWKSFDVLPWAPLVNLAQEGWAKGKAVPVPPDYLPEHFLVISTTFRGQTDKRTKRSFPPLPSLQFSLVPEGRTAIAQAGDLREGEYYSDSLYVAEEPSPPLPDSSSSPERKRGRGGGRRLAPKGPAPGGKWFAQEYKVTFDLLNSDGTPRIVPGDRSLRLVLREDKNEVSLNFDLRYWRPGAYAEVK